MANKHRGEITARLDGKTYTLCLTLGALAELEAAFGDEDMLALATRFETGRLKAGDAIRVIGAGLRGAGHGIADEDVAKMQAEDGAAGFVRIIGALLTATFAGSERETAEAKTDVAQGEERGAARPFPGGR